MGRMYIAPIDIAATALQCDFVELIAATEKPIAVHEVYITTDVEQNANEAQEKLRVVRYSGTYTSGNGGAVNAHPLDQNGAVDAATVEVGALSSGTLAAVGTGTEEILGEPYMNNRVGYHYLPTPEARPVIAGTDAFVVGLQAVPAASTAFGGYIVFEELV